MIEPNCGARKIGNSLHAHQNKFRKRPASALAVRMRSDCSAQKATSLKKNSASTKSLRVRRPVVPRFPVRALPVLGHRRGLDRIKPRKREQAADKSADMGLPGD